MLQNLEKATLGLRRECGLVAPMGPRRGVPGGRGWLGARVRGETAQSKELSIKKSPWHVSSSTVPTWALSDRMSHDPATSTKFDVVSGGLLKTILVLDLLQLYINNAVF